MTIKRTFLFAGRAALCFAVPFASHVPQLAAQPVLGAATASERQAALRSMPTFDPLFQSAIRGATSAFLFSSSKGTESVAAQIGWVVAGQSVAISASTPLDKDNSDTQVASLDGLANGTTVALSLGGLRVGRGFDAADLVRWCERQRDAGRLSADTAVIKCTSFQRGDLPTDLKDDYDANSIFRRGALLWGITAKLGRKTFEFLEGEALDTVKSTRWGHNVGLSVGHTTRLGLASVGFGHERSFKAASKGQLCSPLFESVALKCQEATFAGPSEKSGIYVRIDLKRYVSSWLAISPRVMYKAGDEEVVAGLPLYFLSGKEGLVGGVSGQLSTKEDRSGISLFIGKTFGLTLP